MIIIKWTKSNYNCAIIHCRGRINFYEPSIVIFIYHEIITIEFMWIFSVFYHILHRFQWPFHYFFYLRLDFIINDIIAFFLLYFEWNILIFLILKSFTLRYVVNSSQDHIFPTISELSNLEEYLAIELFVKWINLEIS